MEVMETYILEAHIGALIENTRAMEEHTVALNANTRAMEEHTVALRTHAAAVDRQTEELTKTRYLIERLTEDCKNGGHISIIDAIRRLEKIANELGSSTDKFDHATKRIEGSNSYRR